MTKKILFIINSLKCGGAERLLIDIVRGLSDKQYDITILTFNNIRMFEDALPDNARLINTIGVGSRTSHYFRRLLSWTGTIDSYYRRKIRGATEEYDTIISFLEGFPLRAHSYLLDRANRHLTFVHTDFSIYNDSIRQFTNTESARRIYDKMDNIIFVSHGALEGFNKVIPGAHTPRTVLENGIDIEAIKEKAREKVPSSESFSVVTVGRVTKVKGFDLIPEMARIFKDRKIKIHFNIVGDGGYMQQLKQLAKSLDVTDMVTFIGFQSNPYPYILSSDIYISTSIAEGLPLSLCEAMALGKPIVATPTAGAKELLSDGTGIIAERNAEEFCKTISQLMQHPAMAEEYGLRAARKATRYDKHQYIKRLIKLI